MATAAPSTNVQAPGDRSFRLLTAVDVVLRECLSVRGELPHVAHLIDAFLSSFSADWTLAFAYKRTASLHCMQLLAARESTEVEEPLLRVWIFNNAVSLAAGRGDQETLTWLAETYFPDAFLSTAAAAAAASGQLDVLKWLYEAHYARVHWGGLEWCEALRGGHLEVIEWLRGCVAPHIDAAPRVIFEAAEAGNLEVMLWLHDVFNLPVATLLEPAQKARRWRVVQWILTHCEVADRWVDADAVAKDGDLLLLQWAYRRVSIKLSSRTLSIAALNGHLAVVTWLYDGPINVALDSSMFAQAARGGHLDVVKWLHERQCPATAAAVDYAAENGFLDVVQWLYANREETCTSRGLDGAARNGHLEVVKWLHETGKPFYCPFVMDSAAENGHLEVVKWLHSSRSEGCTADAMTRAARHGHLDVVKWLNENRSEGCTVAAMDGAAAAGHLDVVKWLHRHSGEGCTTSAMDTAAREGHLEVVKWLHANRTEGCTRAAMSLAAARGHVEVVRWLHQNRSEGCSQNSMARAVAGGHFDVALFLHHERGLKLSCVTGNLVKNPRWELVQWLLQTFPGELDSVWFMMSTGDWYLNDWMRRQNFRQAHQDDRRTGWIWEATT